jgi:hypothetical protein
LGSHRRNDLAGHGGHASRPGILLGLLLTDGKGAEMGSRRSQSRFVRILVLAGVVLLLCLAMAAVALAAWPDVPGDRSGQYGVSDQELEAISEGFPDGLWRPDDPLSRAQFAKMAVRAFKLSPVTPTVPSFTDVPSSDKFYTDIESAVAAGLMQGREDGVFDPTATVTRGEAVAIVGSGLARARGATLSSYYTPERVQEIVMGFLDGATVPFSLAESVAYAVEKGLSRGSSDGHLDPLRPITRIQGAALLVRAMSLQASFGETVPFYYHTSPPYTTTEPGATTTEPPAGAISGRVTAADGSSVFGGAALLDVDGNVVTSQYLEYGGENSGGYSFLGLSPGDYRLRIISPQYVGVYCGGVPVQGHSPAESQVIHVSVSKVRIDFVLEKAYQVSGHIAIAGLSEAGLTWCDQPPKQYDPYYLGPWVVMNLQLFNESGREVRLDQLGWGGRSLHDFVFFGVMPGRYKLQATILVSSEKSAEVWFPAAHSSEEAGWIVVSDADVTDIDLYLGVLPAGALSSTTTVSTIPVE